MTITIEHLNREALKRLIDEQGLEIIETINQEEEGLYECILSDKALLTTHIDYINVLGLGKGNATINNDEYFTIIIV